MILETANILAPISVRLIINENIGHFQNQILKTFFTGKNSPAFQEADEKIFEIMNGQNTVFIPSIERSIILSFLDIGKANATLFPIRTQYGYYGCFWACFKEENWNDEKKSQLSNFFEWMNDTLSNALENDFSIISIANHYAAFLEVLKSPAFIIITPDQICISNPLFESLEIKDNILTAAKSGADISKICGDYKFETRKISFPNNKDGIMYIFHSPSEKELNTVINNDELDYIELIINQVAGNLELIDSSGNLTLLQHNYKISADSQMERLHSLLLNERKHYSGLTDPKVHAFEIISISEIVKNVINDLKPTARKKKIDLNLALDKESENSSSSGNAIGDPWLLTLAVYNLINNAIKNSKQEGKAIQTNLIYRINTWVLRVEDEGSGIAPLDLETMKHYASELDQNLTEAHGIRLVQYVVNKHKGKLTIESSIGKGSLFQIEIPYY